MNELIPWFFSLLASVWRLITQYWLLSIFFLIGVINMIIDIFLETRGN